jgi:hypothetical protein
MVKPDGRFSSPSRLGTCLPNACDQLRAHPIMRRVSGAHHSATVGCSALLASATTEPPGAGYDIQWIISCRSRHRSSGPRTSHNSYPPPQRLPHHVS